MIPKIIHYCWFGRGEKPESVKKCIASWGDFCPDYEIIEWNEDNCNLTAMPFIEEAYKSKKYAFVSDVIRLMALQQMGGIYVDTDVEFVKNFDSLLDDTGFIGFENNSFVNSGQVLGCQVAHPILEQMLNLYRKEHFIKEDGSLSLLGCPIVNTQAMVDVGLKLDGSKQIVEQMTVYPSDYFNPLDSATGKLIQTKNTYSIHWYSQSWMKGTDRMRSKISRIFHRVFGVNCFRWLKGNSN